MATYARLLARLLSSGLCLEPTHTLQYNDEPKIPCYTVHPTTERGYLTNTDIEGNACDKNTARAQLRSAAECLERLSLFNPRSGSVSAPLTFTENEDYVDPTAFHWYSKEQVEEKDNVLEIIRNEPLGWVNAIEIVSKEIVKMPAQLIFLNEIADKFFVVRETTTSGTALGVSGTESSLHRGILELIERDACMHAYLTKKRLPRITDFPVDIQNLLNYLSRYRLESNVFVATSDLGVPTIITILIDRTGIGPAITVGSSSAVNYADAVIHSVLESVQNRSITRFMKGLLYPRTLPRANEVSTLISRIYFWWPVERIHELDFWLSDPLEVTFSSLESVDLSFNNVIDVLRERQYHVYSVDVTLPEIAAVGFEILKTLVPELHPLYLSEDAIALSSTHYGDLKFNPDLPPHPFT